MLSFAVLVSTMQASSRTFAALKTTETGLSEDGLKCAYQEQVSVGEGVVKTLLNLFVKHIYKV